jgi:integrase
MLALLSACGVRRDELCLIKDADVNLVDLQMRVYPPKTTADPVAIGPFSEETGALLAT